MSSKVIITTKLIGNFFESFSKFLTELSLLETFSKDESVWIMDMDMTITRTANTSIRIEIGGNPHSDDGGAIYTITMILENVFELTYVGNRCDYGLGGIRQIIGGLKIANQVSVQKLETEIFDFNSNQ